MKLNKKYLIESILEVMMEDDELTPRSDFEKLMSALTSDLSNARQAWEMYDLGAYELSPEEEAEAKQAMARVIVTDSDNPGKDLQEIGFDFHQVFEQYFGFSPPRSKEFQLWGGKGGDEELSLRTTVDGKDVEFEFWWDMPMEDVFATPWFRFETMHDMDGYVTFEKGVISINEDDYSTRSSKEELPSALRSAMGISWDADVPEWPELPKGQPPVDGPEGTDEPVYEGKRKLDKNYLFESIREVMNDSDEELSAKARELIISNDASMVLQGLELYSVGNLSYTRVPYVLDSLERKGYHYDYLFLGVEDETAARNLIDFLRRHRKRSATRPKQDRRGAKIETYAFGTPKTAGLKMDLEAGNYVVKILLDLPPLQPPPRKKFWGPIKEDEDSDDSYSEITNKINQFISSKDLTYYKQGFHIIEVYEMSDLISKEQANELLEDLWLSVWDNELYSEDTIEDIAELLEDHTSLAKDFKEDMEENIYYHGGQLVDDVWALKYALRSFDVDIEVIDIDNLYSIGSATQETLEKAKERLLDFDEEERFFEWDFEEGRLLYGPLASTYVNFEKKIEEIFGATPGGDVSFGGGNFLTISKKINIEEPFDSPMVKQAEVTADVMFEWSPESEYGMEITLTPAKVTTWPPTSLQDYYGLWISTAKDGPNIGKLEIGIQNYEDEFEDHKLVQNSNGTYGFTADEMKEKIKEMTGVDLNEIR